jgi:predicted permease
VVVLTLALGIGANTATFGFLDRLLLRSLPVQKPHELALVAERWQDGLAGGVATSFNYPLYAEYRDRNQVFSGLTAYSDLTVSLRVGEANELIKGVIVSGNYFSLLGVKAALGRAFLPEEDRQPLTHPVTVISHGLWQRRFGADPAVVGKTITLNGHPFTVVGIAPREFRGTIAGAAPELYVPMMMQPWVMSGRDPSFNPLQQRTFVWLELLGRLKPGVTHQQAQAAMKVLAGQIAKVEPMNTGTNLLILEGRRGHDQQAQQARLPLLLLMATVGLVLLIACANVANLLLARAVTRQREIAVRLAVGASRGRIIRQLLNESLLLAGLGGGCGVLLALWLGEALAALVPPDFPVRLEAGLDYRILLFAVAASVATGIAFGLAPAWQASRAQLVPVLKEGAPVAEVLRRRWGLRNLLVVGQVAMSLMVLVCAGLCLRSLNRLQAIELGFDPARLLAVWIDTGLAGYSEARGQQFFANLKERAGALPGVQAASVTPFMPLSGRGGRTDVERIEGYEIPEGKRVDWNFSLISPDYFRTLGFPLLLGRDFSAQDGANSLKVLIVNQVVARRYWPNQDPIGKRVTLSSPNQDAGPDVREVIGVVRDGKFRKLLEEPTQMMYFPLTQSQFFEPVSCLLLRSASEPRALLAAVRSLVRSLDPDLPLLRLSTLAEHRSRLLFPQRLVAMMLGAFGLVGLLLAATGIYAVIAYAVDQRTREIGIRMALGAQWEDVVRLIVREGAILVAAGLALGAGAALAATRLMRSFLYGVGAGDPLTYASAALLLALVALAACWLPARRAARTDPMVALRYE